jgi:hypothetical protein
MASFRHSYNLEEYPKYQETWKIFKIKDAGPLKPAYEYLTDFQSFFVFFPKARGFQLDLHLNSQHRQYY